jgi:[ribosomal protein S18]-alanine N-acetyltransferase
VNIRPANAADISHILELERACPTAAHWTEQQYRQAFQPEDAAERLCLVADCELTPGNAASEATSISGFLIARRVDHEWELENLVIAPQSRRSGLGKRLLERLLTEVRATNGERVFLEVRASNTPARSLYEKMGFEQTGRRNDYYSNPQEDAVVYSWNALPNYAPNLFSY